MREVREELGKDIILRPLGTVHTFTYLIPAVGYVVDVCYLLAYEGGEIVPGDDEAGSTASWWTREQLDGQDVEISVPRDQKWLLGRALELYGLWKDRVVELQPGASSRAFAWPPADPPSAAANDEWQSGEE